ncbi:MAG: right-handed parallel beta-helix repeat-containing protein [Xanthobacteraceae bacterium]
MKKVAFSAIVLGATMVAPLLYSAPAHAQATRTWVSGVGDDLNPCSRTAPCKTFSGALGKTADGGEINCLDAGGFGAATIAKSITIDCAFGFGSVLNSLTNGFTINTAGVVVYLRNLEIEGSNTASMGFTGIRFLQGSALHVHNVRIRNQTTHGIEVAPGGGGTSKVFIADSYISKTGNAATEAAILVRPTGGTSVNISIDNTHLENSPNGVLMDAGGAGGASNMHISRSVITGMSTAGVSLISAAIGLNVLVDESKISMNGTGVSVSGAGSSARLGGNTIFGNGTGVNNAGGTMQSFKDNRIVANGGDGTPIPAVNSGGNILN